MTGIPTHWGPTTCRDGWIGGDGGFAAPATTGSGPQVSVRSSELQVDGRRSDGEILQQHSPYARQGITSESRATV